MMHSSTREPTAGVSRQTGDQFRPQAFGDEPNGFRPIPRTGGTHTRLNWVAPQG
ncbi:MAG: hypothetical protein J6B02_00910 [Selenomonadales bacterium]|nr:hypothetical protein [Selenomonadales bacterium]